MTAGHKEHKAARSAAVMRRLQGLVQRRWHDIISASSSCVTGIYCRHTCRSSAHRQSLCVPRTHPDRWDTYWYHPVPQPRPLGMAQQGCLEQPLPCPSDLQSLESACGTCAERCATCYAQSLGLKRLLKQLLHLLCCVDPSDRHMTSGSTLLPCTSTTLKLCIMRRSECHAGRAVHCCHTASSSQPAL